MYRWIVIKNMQFKIGKDTKEIIIVREEKVFINSTTIHKGTFGDFPGDIKEIVIPEGVTNIEDNAFEGCVDLTTITLPGSLKHIGRGAFADCKKLKNVVVPDSISTIACWGERRVWKTEMDKPFTDLAQHLIKGLEMELNSPANWNKKNRDYVINGHQWVWDDPI